MLTSPLSPTAPVPGATESESPQATNPMNMLITKICLTSRLYGTVNDIAIALFFFVV